MIRDNLDKTTKEQKQHGKLVCYKKDDSTLENLTKFNCKLL